METSFLIVGSVCLWGYLGSKATNQFLKTFMMIETLLLTIAMGWIGWFSVDQTELIALDIWRYVISIIFIGWIGVYGGLWITGALEKEEIENGF